MEKLKKKYIQSFKKFIRIKHKELYKWLKLQCKNGYKPICDIDYIDDLINELSNNFIDSDLNDLIGENEFLKCEYRNEHHGKIIIFNDNTDEVIDVKDGLVFKVNRKEVTYNPYIRGNELSRFYFDAEKETGKVYVNINLLNYVKQDDITLDELLVVLKKYKNNIEFNELESCVFNHNCDLELRNKIFELVSLKLMFLNSNLENGFDNANKFINDINDFYNTSVSRAEINNRLELFYDSVIDYNPNNIILKLFKK